MSFDIELDTVDIDECDAPQTAQPEKNTIENKRNTLLFYGFHACRNLTTQVRTLNYTYFSQDHSFRVCRKHKI